MATMRERQALIEEGYTTAVLDESSDGKFVDPVHSHLTKRGYKVTESNTRGTSRVYSRKGSPDVTYTNHGDDTHSLHEEGRGSSTKVSASKLLKHLHEF